MADIKKRLGTVSIIAESVVRSEQKPLGQSPRMSQLRKLIGQVAPHDTLVLVQGESGRGKEVAAKAIHEASPRRDKPFVPVNCGAIPADLLESELFGHEKGAFTGAIATRKGRFEMAEGGTLFLDEIGDMSMPMQVKLLRVLQERCYERVGSNQTRHCDVRIVAATHRNLEQMIEDGEFRHDLFFRLNVFPVMMPALRDHVEDIPALVEHFLCRQRAQGKKPCQLSKTAMRALSAYHWPGNIRELENLLERLMITHGGVCVRARDLPVAFQSAVESLDAQDVETDQLIGEPAQAEAEIDDRQILMDALVEPAMNLDTELTSIPSAGFDLKSYLQELEKNYIEMALQECSGTVTKAAQLLGLQRTTLTEKMKKLRLQLPS